MEFKRVVIQNFKGIENMELTFFPGVNLILGENGVGKTSVLEAMTIAFGDFFNGIAGVNKRGILHEDIHFRTSLTGDASTKIEYCTPTTVRSEIHLDKATVTGEVTRRDETSQSRTKYLGKNALYMQEKFVMICIRFYHYSVILVLLEWLSPNEKILALQVKTSLMIVEVAILVVSKTIWIERH